MGCLAATPTGARALHLTLLCAGALASWLLRDYAGWLLARGGATAAGCRGAANPAACAAATAPLRVAFGSVAFFAAHAVGLLCVTRASDPRHLLHAGCPAAQFAAWAGLVVAGFFLPQKAVVGFGGACVVLAAVYLFLQLLIMIDWLFAVNSFLVDREDAPWALPALVGGTALAYVGAGVALGFIGHRFAPAATCSLNAGVIAITVLLAVAAGALSVTPVRPPAAGLFSAAGVALYLTYLAWTALAALPPGAVCAPATPPPTAVRVVSLVVTLALLTYAALTAGASAGAVSLSRDEEGGGGDDDKEAGVRPDFFHAVLATAAAYVAMIFSSWSLAVARGAPPAASVDVGWAPFGIKLANLIVTGLVYCFAMVAPALLPDRDFS